MAIRSRIPATNTTVVAALVVACLLTLVSFPAAAHGLSGVKAKLSRLLSKRLQLKRRVGMRPDESAATRSPRHEKKLIDQLKRTTDIVFFSQNMDDSAGQVERNILRVLVRFCRQHKIPMNFTVAGGIKPSTIEKLNRVVLGSAKGSENTAEGVSLDFYVIPGTDYRVAYDAFDRATYDGFNNVAIDPHSDTFQTPGNEKQTHDLAAQFGDAILQHVGALKGAKHGAKWQSKKRVICIDSNSLIGKNLMNMNVLPQMMRHNAEGSQPGSRRVEGMFRVHEVGADYRFPLLSTAASVVDFDPVKLFRHLVPEGVTISTINPMTKKVLETYAGCEGISYVLDPVGEVFDKVRPLEAGEKRALRRHVLRELGLANSDAEADNILVYGQPIQGRPRKVFQETLLVASMLKGLDPRKPVMLLTRHAEKKYQPYMDYAADVAKAAGVQLRTGVTDLIGGVIREYPHFLDILHGFLLGSAQEGACLAHNEVFRRRVPAGARNLPEVYQMYVTEGERLSPTYWDELKVELTRAQLGRSIADYVQAIKELNEKPFARVTFATKASSEASRPVGIADFAGLPTEGGAFGAALRSAGVERAGQGNYWIDLRHVGPEVLLEVARGAEASDAYRQRFLQKNPKVVNFYDAVRAREQFDAAQTSILQRLRRRKGMTRKQWALWTEVIEHNAKVSRNVNQQRFADDVLAAMQGMFEGRGMRGPMSDEQAVAALRGMLAHFLDPVKLHQSFFYRVPKL